MATGRIRRTARRGIAALVLAWLGALVAAAALAPGASADSAVTVYIRDITPPVVSVDQGGTVTFINDLADKAVEVSIGGLVPTSVTVTVHTDVTLDLPSGAHPLTRGDQVKEKFGQTCATCAIAWKYRADSGPGITSTVIGQALGTLPALPAVPEPLVVNTIAPLPNAPSVNLPQPPAVTVTLPAPQLPSLPGGQPPAAAPVPVPQGTVQPPAASPGGTTVQGIPGTAYTYDTGSTPQMAPVDGTAAAAFDPSRFPGGSQGLSGGTGSSSSGGTGTGSGSGGLAGSYDGASVPVFGQLAGLDGRTLDDRAGDAPLRDGSGTGASLPVPALVAVVALAAVTAALVRTHQAARGR